MSDPLAKIEAMLLDWKIDMLLHDIARTVRNECDDNCPTREMLWSTDTRLNELAAKLDRIEAMITEQYKKEATPRRNDEGPLGLGANPSGV